MLASIPLHWVFLHRNFSLIKRRLPLHWWLHGQFSWELNSHHQSVFLLQRHFSHLAGRWRHLFPTKVQQTHRLHLLLYRPFITAKKWQKTIIIIQTWIIITLWCRQRPIWCRRRREKLKKQFLVRSHLPHQARRHSQITQLILRHQLAIHRRTKCLRAKFAIVRLDISTFFRTTREHTLER